jgi:hypothetical protein
MSKVLGCAPGHERSSPEALATVGGFASGYHRFEVPFSMADFLALEAEIGEALRSRFATRRDFPIWLTGLDSSFPVGSSLAIDDGRLWFLAEQLLGRPVVPCPPEVGFLAGPTPLHFDDPMGVRGIKFILYLDVASGVPGLEVLPGSHRSPIHESVNDLCQVLGKQKAAERLKSMMIELEPVSRSMVAIDLHLWHHFPDHRERILWCPEYVALPETSAEAVLIRQKFCEVAAHDTAELISGSSSVWRQWLLRTDRGALKRLAIERLDACGAFVNGQADR